MKATGRTVRPKRWSYVDRTRTHDPPDRQGETQKEEEAKQFRPQRRLRLLAMQHSGLTPLFLGLAVCQRASIVGALPAWCTAAGVLSRFTRAGEPGCFTCALGAMTVARLAQASAIRSRLVGLSRARLLV
jgi:hypothetical protein